MIYLGFSWYNTLNVRSMNLIANASKIPWTSLNVTGVCQIPNSRCYHVRRFIRATSAIHLITVDPTCLLGLA